MHRRPARRLVTAGLLVALASCDLPSPAISRNPPVADGPADARPCVLASTAVTLLGRPGDSPIVPVRVGGRDAAMFFSPGFAPVLFSRNGSIGFERSSPHALGTQDGETVQAWLTRAPAFSIGDGPPADQAGLLLPQPETRVVDGRPLVGMLGRAILSDDAVVSLDLPGRSAIISRPRTAECLDLAGVMATQPVAMQEELLEVPVRINGRRLRAVLDPDLSVSILPNAVAESIGIRAADLAGDPEVRTQFGRGVLGRRHRVDTLELGDTRLAGFTFDVESRVDDVMLGLNFFGRGIAVFDFGNDAFFFRQTADAVPRSTSLHFDQTRVVHVNIRE